MAGKKSKDKGKGYEREVADFLTSTYGDKFIRTPFSGAFVGGINAVRKESLTQGQIRNAKGDIVPPDHWNNFSVECKFYKEFPFHQIFTGDVALLDTWIQQQADASDEDDLQLIFMKFNRRGQWVAYPSGLGFSVDRAISYKGWYFCAWDMFWTEHNISLVKKYGTAGIKQ